MVKHSNIPSNTPIYSSSLFTADKYSAILMYQGFEWLKTYISLVKYIINACFWNPQFVQ